MKPLTIPLPRGAREMFNSLYDSREPTLLTQDILLVELPNDTFIDVGWYPEHDPSGAYCIRVYQEHWDNQLLSQPVRTQRAQQVVKEVDRLAKQYSAESVAKVSWPTGHIFPSAINTTCSSSVISTYGPIMEAQNA